MAGIVHFSVFFTYMEEAEHEFLRSIGLGVFTEIEEHQVSWPRVAASCNYKSAIKFENELDIRLTISRIGEKSVSYDHQIYCDETLVADGRVTAVCCRMLGHAKPESISIPPQFLEKLQPYLASDS